MIPINSGRKLVVEENQDNQLNRGGMRNLCGNDRVYARKIDSPIGKEALIAMFMNGFHTEVDPVDDTIIHIVLHTVEKASE